jgi:hypothetical protein
MALAAAAHVSMDRQLSSSIAAATKAARAEVLVVLFAVEVPWSVHLPSPSL